MEYLLREKKILIYGAGDAGKLACHVLQNGGTQVAGFIDQRWEKIIELNKLPVFSIEDAKKIEDKNSYLIIITFKNLFQQQEVAESLFQMGYVNILFKPQAILYGTCHDEKLLRISEGHEILLEEDRVPEIPIFSIDGLELSVYSDGAIIEDKGEEIIANIPSELLCNNYEADSPWAYKSFLATYPAVDMYKSFEKSSEKNIEKGINEYIDKVAKLGARVNGLSVDEGWSTHVVAGRATVFQEMKRRKALDFNFFIKNCVEVTEFKNGRFLLNSSGKNRICFLIAEGHLFIPVRMPKKAYEVYLNYKEVNELIEYLKQNVKLKITFPIPHPFFYNYVYDASDYSEKWLMRVGRILSKYYYDIDNRLDFSCYSIIDATLDNGTSSRFFDICGYKVYRINDHNEITTRLDQLFRQSIPDVKEKIAEETEILLLSDRVQNIENILDKYSARFVFYQKWNDEKENLEAIEKQFSIVSIIFKAFWGDKFVEGYFLVKKDFVKEKECNQYADIL